MEWINELNLAANREMSSDDRDSNQELVNMVIQRQSDRKFVRDHESMSQEMSAEDARRAYQCLY
jgi:hypothetical protein